MVKISPSAIAVLRGSLLAAALALSLPAGAASDSKAARLYEDALQRYQKKDIHGAIVQLKNALQADRTLLPVHVLLGRALLANGDFIGAEVAFNEALRLGVDRAEVLLPLARAFVGQGKRQPLFDDPRFAASGLTPGVRAPLLLLQAGAHADLGRVREALAAIEQARAIEPASADSYLAEVPIRVRLRQFPEATAAADRAIALAPELAEGHYLRASVAHAQSNLAEALAGYSRALRTQADHLESLLARAGIALDQNRLTEAKLDISAARRSQPREPRAVYLGAVIAEREGQGAVARAALAEITSLIDPVPAGFLRYRPQLLILGGLAHHGLGQFEKARPYFEIVQRDQPGSPVAKLLAQIHLAEKRGDRAIEVLDLYLRSHPRDVQALSLLASGHMAQGRHARATQILQDTLAKRDDPQLRTQLGLSLASAGKLADALAPLEAAYARDPGQVQAGVALVSLHLREQRGKKAIDVAEALVRRQPAQPGLHNLLGQVHQQTGNLARARIAFDEAARLDPAFLAPRLALARLDMGNNQLDSATSRLTALLKADDKNIELLNELGRLAERRGQIDEATRYFNKAADHSAPSDVQPGLALLDHHLRGGRIERAQEALRRLEAKAPGDLQVLIAGARVALAANNREAARAALARASRQANFDAPAQTGIALLQLAAADAQGATASLNQALQADPQHLPAQALMVDAQVQLGQLAAADSRARDVVKSRPQLALGHALLGDVAAARGDAAAALEAYRRAQQIEPSSQNLLRLVRAMAVRDPQTALALAEAWLGNQPQDLQVRRMLADGHASRGDMPAARRAYEQLLKLAPDVVGP
jgi:cellulose synthase operon protein C